MMQSCTFRSLASSRTCKVSIAASQPSRHGLLRNSDAKDLFADMFDSGIFCVNHSGRLCLAQIVHSASNVLTKYCRMSERDARCPRGYCAQHPKLMTCTTCRGCYSPHPSIPSAANATRILLDDRNRYKSHAPTSILDRRDKAFTPPNRMPAKHETRRDQPTRFSNQTWRP